MSARRPLLREGLFCEPKQREQKQREQKQKLGEPNTR
jgi:hypothetical protein